MLTMEPSIKRGLTVWDRALMPTDEFDERVRLVQAEMRRLGLDALVLHGNMYEDADLVYLIGYNVDGTLVLPAEGEPAIFTNSGSRESYFFKTLTWLQDLSHRGPLVGKAVAEKLKERNVTKGRIGTAGLQALASRAYHDLVGALSGYELADFGPALSAIRSRVRPRELAAVRIALGIAAKAVGAAEQAFAAGGSNAAAMVEAERVARLAGAWDVRVLANLGGSGLRPLEDASPDRRSPLLLWVAARHQGYWADASNPSAAPPGSEAATAIAAMTAAAKAGATAGSVAEAGLASLAEPSRRWALAYGLGQGIGGELNGSPTIEPGSKAALAEGALLSFRVCALGGPSPSLASVPVEVRASGAEPIQAR